MPASSSTSRIFGTALRLVRRERDRDRRADVRRRVDLDAAAEGAHRLADDREAEAEAVRVAAARTVEAVEDAFLLARRHPGAGVPNGDLHGPIVPFGGEHDAAAARVLGRVLHQVA